MKSDSQILQELWNRQYIYKKDIKDIDYSHLPETVQNGIPRQILWHLINNINHIVRCKCGNPVKWTTKFNAYRTYCSSKCSANDIIIREKYKATILEKYGVENAFQSQEVKQKIRQTNIDKYGVEHALQNNMSMNKMKNTLLSRYGVDNAQRSEEFKEKTKQTNIERYGVDHVLQNSEVKEKIKQTNIEKYGTDNPMKNEEIQAKARATNLEKYGVEFPMKLEEIQMKMRLTNGEKYGVEYVLQNQDIKEQIKQTNIEKYGSYNPFGSSIIQDKIKQTNLEKYGVMNYSQQHITPDALKIMKNSSLFCEFIKDRNVYEICRDLGIEETTFYNLLTEYNAYDLYKKRGATYLEIEMAEFLNSLNIKYEINNRSILQGQEIDFYLPQFMLAIEMNGLHWHTDAKRPDPKYHYNKWKACDDLNIHLISIFEDVWNLKNDIIKNILLSHFNMKPKGIPARKTTIKQIDATISRSFLEQYHIQGFVGGTHFGAFDLYDNLIAVMTFGYTRNQRFELKRFAMDNYNHPGVFSKLFKYVQNELKFDEVVSFSDNNWFTGNVYRKNGFDFIQVIDQDYKYLVNKKQEHKSNYKKENIKKKFPHMAEAINNGLSETAAMEYLNIPKVYDCGKKEWIWRR